MSIRDELADILEALDGGDYMDIADAVLARYAVVELPEPTGHWGGGPEWRDGDAVVWTALASNVMVQNVGGGDLSPHHARVLAAALLAAAKRAEGQQ